MANILYALSDHLTEEEVLYLAKKIMDQNNIMKVHDS